MAPRRNKACSHDGASAYTSAASASTSAAPTQAEFYQPELPFPSEGDPALPVTEPDPRTGPSSPHEGNELARELLAYRSHLLSLLSDAIAQYEIASQRSQLARILAPGRAQATLAAISLDHVVLPRWAVENLLTDYASHKDRYGTVDDRMEDLQLLYRAATGWT